MTYKSVRKILSENLKKQMHDKNVTQQQLSDSLGVSQSTISNWLREEKYPRIQHIQQLADFFNVPKSSLTEDRQTKQDNLAAHLDGDFTEEELAKIREYAEMVRKAHRNM
ncbi:helix-turn-helix transcriptional regulator [Mammaliicoccus sciuri]|uniref:helix-turn-helix domain-containing protein n=1 Tax=Mammaliicoccus sciuri TaxID=1296 RepID=UPI0019D3E697|nr:helix-turn-helix transcriptional regulator [Mammaliicoccus sciuri]MEB8072187.1 helix-turn-helix domain-containing protein [Mammaliicoccus sciuri]QSN67053.1 helix-turn-helix transcriptional regulator [Mammaliicoccus sciuri]UIU21777.1 helix-turn-helix domain-containing protein [Mammaliicoccus sciuri]UIU24677.1 helix-turn-helix domain-containing protein [Mammaliicoccus sciuri]